MPHSRHFPARSASATQRLAASETAKKNPRRALRRSLRPDARMGSAAIREGRHRVGVEAVLQRQIVSEVLEPPRPDERHASIRPWSERNENARKLNIDIESHFRLIHGKCMALGHAAHLAERKTSTWRSSAPAFLRPSGRARPFARPRGELLAILEQGRRSRALLDDDVRTAFILHSAFHDLPNDGGSSAPATRSFSARPSSSHTSRRTPSTIGSSSPFALRHARRAREAHGRRLPVDARHQSWARARARVVVVATSGQPCREKSAPRRGKGLLRAAPAQRRLPQRRAPFRGRSVLVVGSGNSAAEIALDLVQGGAGSVAMWVRGARHFIPKGRVEGALSAPSAPRSRFTPAELAAKAHAITRGTPEFEAAYRPERLDHETPVGRPLAPRHPQAHRGDRFARRWTEGGAFPCSTSARSRRSAAVRSR